MKHVLVFGDAHIPSRRDSIPPEFFDHIQQTKYDLALVTGDLVRESDLRAAMPPLPKCHIVTGNMDYGSSYDFHEAIRIENLGFLLIHGTQLRPRGNIDQLWQIAVQMDLDVAIHGHTHKEEIKLHRGKLVLNPGTISGATGGWPGRDNATFLELEVNNDDIRVVLYHTDWRTMKKSEINFRKDDAVMTTA